MLSTLILSISLLAASQAKASENEIFLPDDPEVEQSVGIEEMPAESLFETLSVSAQDLQRALDQYSFVDPLGMIPKNLLAMALTQYDANSQKITNKAVLTVVDFSQYSGFARFFIINMNDGSVRAIHVAHGSASDPMHSGYATRFSNVSGSNMTSLGAYLGAESYSGAHGFSLRLDGLSATNSNARARAIVLHGANYVVDANVNQGRSWGCLAIPMADRDQVVRLLQGGSLIYAGLSGLPLPKN